MKVYDFAQCCTARIIYGWNGYAGGGFAYMPGTSNNPIHLSNYANYQRWAVASLMDCCEKIVEYQQRINGRGFCLERIGLIFTTFTTDQVHAIQFAEEVGFTCTGPSVPKTKHPETELVGYVIDSLKLKAWYEEQNDENS